MAAHCFRAQRLRILTRSSKQRADAEEQYFKRQQEEANVLLHAAQKGCDWTALDPQLAFTLAHAARSTVLAEEEALERKIEECRRRLTTLTDARDDARGRLTEADFQMATIASFLKRAGIALDFSGKALEPSPFLHPTDYGDLPGSPAEPFEEEGSDSGVST